MMRSPGGASLRLPNDAVPGGASISSCHRIGAPKLEAWWAVGRIRQSIELMKQSWAVLKQDRELIWLPVISAVVAAVVAAVVLVPVALAQDWGRHLRERRRGDRADRYRHLRRLRSAHLGPGLHFDLLPGGFGLGRTRAHDGRRSPRSGSAIAGALERLPKLFSWAVITTIVGTILRAIEQRTGWLGRIVINIVGMAWAVTTFLVIPVIIIENVGAIDSTKRSVELFRHTWGENLSAQVGFSLIGFMMFIPLVIVAVLGAAIGTLIGFLLIAAAVLGAIVVDYRAERSWRRLPNRALSLRRRHRTRVYRRHPPPPKLLQPK